VVRNLDQGTQQRVPLDEVVRALAETGLVESAVEAMLAGLLEEDDFEDDEDGAEEPGAR
jgi:histidyl-tRNA synthetase